MSHAYFSTWKEEVALPVHTYSNDLNMFTSRTHKNIAKSNNGVNVWGLGPNDVIVTLADD